IYIVHGGSPESGGLPIIATEADGDAVEFEEVLDTRISAVEMDARQEAEPSTVDGVRRGEEAASRERKDVVARVFAGSRRQTSTSGAVRPDEEAVSRELKDEISELFAESLPQTSPGAVGGKPGNNKVTRRSFTVWTEPEDPSPRMPYFIYIQMAVPRSLSRID